MAHKNDYTCIVFFQNGSPKKWQYVHGLTKFVIFLNREHPQWKYVNVYERRTNIYLRRFYPGNSIPYFLALIPFLFLLHFFLTFNNSSMRTFNNDFNNTATIPTHLDKKGGAKC